MIGVIFNALEKVVIEDFGEDVWDTLLDETGSDGVYHAMGKYDDADVFNFIKVAAEKLNLTETEVQRWFGRRAMDEFYANWPELFKPYNTVFELVLSLNDIIHPHVKQLYPAASVPEFNMVNHSEDTLTVEYISHRGMSAVAEGLILGAGKVFDQQISVEQLDHIDNGEKHCHLVIRVEA